MTSGIELRPYQTEAIKAILGEWSEHDKTLLVLPTGTGKTIVFANIAKIRTAFGRVLILAHRDELLNQAMEKLHKACGLTAAKEKADSTTIGTGEAVTVGSVQTLMSEKRLSRFSPDYFDTVIVDEAHHALADSYQRVLSHFAGAKVLGVTATPDRGDMKNLGEYFESLAYEYSLRDAVNQGYLSPIRVKTVPLDIDISSAKISQGDYQAGDLGHALEPYLADIADAMVDACKDRKTVVFLPLIPISQDFRDMLNARGFRAAEVNGESKDRDVILKEFDEGKFNVLCNSMLLTEGWDCPSVDCIVVLRPTKIRSLYCQMIGRGTRLYPGKEHLLVLDFLWMTGKHKLVHPADIVCQKEEVAEDVTAALEKMGNGGDLFEVEHDVLAERKNALQKALEAAAHARKKSKLIDPLEYVLSIEAGDLADYQPTFGWEMDEPTAKQLAAIQNFGIDSDAVTTKGMASKLLEQLIGRVDMATPKQIRALQNKGFREVYRWKKDEASAIIAELAAVNWQPWRAHLIPDQYQPRRLREETA